MFKEPKFHHNYNWEDVIFLLTTVIIIMAPDEYPYFTIDMWMVSKR